MVHMLPSHALVGASRPDIRPSPASESDTTSSTATAAPSSSASPRRHRRIGGRYCLSASVLVVVAAVILAGCGNSPSSVATPPGSTLYRWGVVGNHGKIGRLELSKPAVVTGKVVQIATSNSDGYALTSAGQVYGWGVNSYGELGDGRQTSYETRAGKVDFPVGVKITSLANPMPFDAAIAIDSTGRVWGWGLNGAGDLCLPNLTYTRPQQIPLSDVSLASGARTHALFDSGGILYACGSGDAGELGNDSTASSGTPTKVAGLPSGAKITALASSWEGSGALLADGAYYDWGYNAAGQLGDGDTTDSPVPVRVNLPSPVSQVFQGGSGPNNGQSIAVLENGTVWTWGDNDRGQLGTGTRSNALTPVKVQVPKGVTFVKVSSGGYATYAIDTTGRLWAWGDNRNGQLGIGSGHRTETLPTRVNIELTQVSATAQNVAGLEGKPR
jgi:alpha-tubulin suppressor-like RCC1 family protein